MRRRMIGGQTVSNGIYILHINGKLYTRDKMELFVEKRRRGSGVDKRQQQLRYFRY